MTRSFGMLSGTAMLGGAACAISAAEIAHAPPPTDKPAATKNSCLAQVGSAFVALAPGTLVRTLACEFPIHRNTKGSWKYGDHLSDAKGSRTSCGGYRGH